MDIVDNGAIDNEDFPGVLTLGTISGSGSLKIQESNGTLVLNQADSYTGGTSIYAPLSIGDGAALGTGAVNVRGNGELIANTSLTMTNALTLSQVPTIAAAAGTTFTINSSNLVFDGSAGPLDITFGDAVNTGTVVLNAPDQTVNSTNPSTSLWPAAP